MQAFKTQQVIRISLLLFGMYALLSARIFHVQFQPDSRTIRLQHSKENRPRWRQGKDLFERGRRGQIRDRNGRLLAGGYDSFELVCDPNAKYRKPPWQDRGYALYERIELMSELLADLGIEHDLEQMLVAGTHQYDLVECPGGVVEARKVRCVNFASGILDHQQAYMSRILASRGIGNFSFPPVTNREYPQGAMLEDVVGRMGWIGDKDEEPRFQGKSGLELALEPLLAGKVGRFECEKDGAGREMDVEGRWIEEPEDGWNVRTGLDLRIQAILDRELAAAVDRFPCSAGCALVMDSQTGEILALSGRAKKDESPRAGAMAVTEAREPGSTIKPLIVAKALEGGYVTWADRFDTNNGMKVLADGRLRRSVRDSSPHQVLDLAEVVIFSSNIGMAMIGVDKMGAEAMARALRELRFDEMPKLHFPAMARSALPSAKDNRLDRTVSPTFGHAISMSPLCLLTAMNAFATGGLRIEPRLVLDIERDGVLIENPLRSSRLVPEEIARDMLLVMERVVTEGTGKVLAKLPWRVAAKTGTAQALPYAAHRFHSSMIAIAPVSRPRLSIYVGLYDVHGGTIYGGSVASPVIEKVIAETLPLLGVAPDKEK